MRTESLRKFVASEVQLLFASDLASRGLDMPCVDAVVNFELPVDSTRYVHRVGRTARAGREGRAATLFEEKELKEARRLYKMAAPPGSGGASKAERRQLETGDAPDKTFQRTKLAVALLQPYADKISSLEEEVKEALLLEATTQELRVVEQQVEKSKNIQKFQSEIKSRPVRTFVHKKANTNADANATKRRAASAGGSRSRAAANDDAQEPQQTRQRGGSAGAGGRGGGGGGGGEGGSRGKRKRPSSEGLPPGGESSSGRGGRFEKRKAAFASAGGKKPGKREMSRESRFVGRPAAGRKPPGGGAPMKRRRKM
eukprot:GHVU01221618.1.p2 GENE.GHVU01221618.1~~GHVU01221618.1.p2  ORF type:complete len:367 (-),score=98.74 GHVU01221618.1:72-1010(-)